MTKGIFITGTDTGVGKTVIAAGIIRALGRRGVQAGAMKPVETGCIDESGTLVARDGMFLRKIAGMVDPAEVVTPVRFSYPLAPMVAAELEGRSVDLDAIMRAYSMLIAKYDFLVVEGAGGIMVPVKESGGSMRAGLSQPAFFMSDLIKSLDLPVVVVARAGLGAINHTLLTVTHAVREGIGVRGVIINSTGPAGNTLAESTNPGLLERICAVPILGVVPYCAAPYDTVDTVATALIDVVAKLIQG
jgi:dethiobiotin synthetase